MTDFDPARIGDVKAGFAAARADTNSRAKKTELEAAVSPLAAKDGSNVEADAFRGAIGAQRRVSVTAEDFGAEGDGVADDTDALGAALDALYLGGVLTLTGKYRVTRPIAKTFADNAAVHIVGYGATIDGRSVKGSAAGDTVLLALGGARLGSGALGADVAKGSAALVASVGAVAGDIVLISSTDLWNPTRPYYVKGEMSAVLSVAGPNLSLSQPLYDGYSAATTTVHRLQMPTVSIEGVRILMDANQIALQLAYVRNPVVRVVRGAGARYATIYADYTVGGSITQNDISDAWYSGTGTSYGVSVGSCQGLIVSENDIREARHCITVGGRETAREIIVESNKAKVHPLETLLSAIDLHGNTELCTIRANYTEGVICAGINATIIDNVITGNKPVALVNILQEIDSDFYTVADNVFQSLNEAVGSIGFWFSPMVASLKVGVLSIERNRGRVGRVGITLSPRNSAATGCSIGDLRLAANSLVAGLGSAFSITSNPATLAIGRLESFSNLWESGLASSFYVSPTTVVGETKSVGDTFKTNFPNASLAHFSGVDVDVTSPTFIGNAAGGGNARSVYYANTGRTRVLNPTYKGLTFRAELAASTEFMEQGWSGITPTILNTAAARLISFYGAKGLAVAYGTAPPTVGTWRTGDVVLNEVPGNAVAIGWQCSVAGTPGTWASMGTGGMVRAAAQADSTATDIAGLRADFNALLAKRRTAREQG